MPDNDSQENGRRSDHAIFIFLGIIFLVSALGGDDLMSYGIGLGLLLMGLFAPHRERFILGSKVDRPIYVTAALMVIATGSVQVISSLLEAIRILRSTVLA
jgi:hypothetical protein